MLHGLVPKEIRLIRRKDTGRVTTMLHPRLTLSRSINGVVNMTSFNAFQLIKALNMFQIVAIPVDSVCYLSPQSGFCFPKNVLPTLRRLDSNSKCNNETSLCC